jgi:hypothetical protein
MRVPPSMLEYEQSAGKFSKTKKFSRRAPQEKWRGISFYFQGLFIIFITI